MNSSTSKIKGFTLIETVLTLSIFSLILLVAYQAMIISAEGRERVSKLAEQQNQLRTTYRSLSNAFDSQAQLKGSQSQIEFDLSTSDSTWLSGAKQLRFVIHDDVSLRAYLDNQQQYSVLMANLINPEFAYFNGESMQNSWNSLQRPIAIELTWFDGGTLQRWRFGRQ